MMTAVLKYSIDFGAHDTEADSILFPSMIEARHYAAGMLRAARLGGEYCTVEFGRYHIIGHAARTRFSITELRP
jgi:hypothetical protein